MLDRAGVGYIVIHFVSRYFACVAGNLSFWLSSMLGSEALDLVRTSHLRCGKAFDLACILLVAAGFIVRSSHS